MRTSRTSKFIASLNNEVTIGFLRNSDKSSGSHRNHPEICQPLWKQADSNGQEQFFLMDRQLGLLDETLMVSPTGIATCKVVSPLAFIEFYQASYAVNPYRRLKGSNSVHSAWKQAPRPFQRFLEVEDMSSDNQVAVERRKHFDDNAPAYRTKLFSIVFNKTHDPEFSHEMSQEALLKYLVAMEKAHWLLEIENEEAYLVRIVQNLVNDKWRVKNQTEWMSLDQQPDDRLLSELSKGRNGVDVENKLYWEKLAQILPWKIIFNGLNERETRVFLLHADGLSNDEIALELNSDVVYIRYELTKVKAKIRARVKKICGKTDIDFIG